MRGGCSPLASLGGLHVVGQMHLVLAAGLGLSAGDIEMEAPVVPALGRRNEA